MKSHHFTEMRNLVNQQYYIWHGSPFVLANEQSFCSNVSKLLLQDGADFIHIVKINMRVCLQRFPVFQQYFTER